MKHEFPMFCSWYPSRARQSILWRDLHPMKAHESRSTVFSPILTSTRAEHPMKQLGASSTTPSPIVAFLSFACTMLSPSMPTTSNALRLSDMRIFLTPESW